nr:hypothetical protein [Klebsormidium flaccidum]
MNRKRIMSFATMLIMGFTATNAKVQFKGLVRKSQDSIQKENANRLSDVISNTEVIRYSNLAIQKASKTAFQLSNYLTLNKIFGSVRVQMLQQPSTRIFEYAFKAKFPASQESTSLIYPRARMYPMIEQEAWATYKGKSNIYRISSVFLWVSGFIAVFNIWPFFKTHSFNQRFIPETFIIRKKSIVSQFDRRIENVWDERFAFSLYKKAKINSTLLNLFSITSIDKNISSNLLTSVSTTNTLQTNSNTYIITNKELKSYITISKQLLNNYQLKNKVKQMKLQFINLFFINYLDQLVNTNVSINIKPILSFSQKFTQRIIIIAKVVLNRIGNLVLNIESFIFITDKENMATQFLLIRINSVVQFIFQTLNKLIRPYNRTIQAILLSWKNQSQQIQEKIELNFSLLKVFSNPNPPKQVILKSYFLKTKVIQKSIKFKEEIAETLHIFKHSVFIYLARLSLILGHIKKDIIFKNRGAKRLIIPFHFDLDYVKRTIDTNKLCAIYPRSDYKNKMLKSTSQIQMKKDNRDLFQQYYKVRLAIKNLNQTAHKYLQTVFFILMNQVLQNLQVIALLIKQKKNTQIALHIEGFFENEKEMRFSIKLNKELSYL